MPERADRTAIRGRLAAVTNLPWTVYEGRDEVNVMSPSRVVAKIVAPSAVPPDLTQPRQVAPFVAAAPTDIAALLESLDEAIATLQEIATLKPTQVAKATAAATKTLAWLGVA